jgi:hypothetical protein
MAYICHSCRTVLDDEDEVVAAAAQLDVTSGGDATRQYVDGQRSFFHPPHYPGNSSRWREIGRGKVRDFLGSSGR